jgi:hypothetical protein
MPVMQSPVTTQRLTILLANVWTANVKRYSPKASPCIPSLSEFLNACKQHDYPSSYHERPDHLHHDGTEKKRAVTKVGK